jgi:hypothetical protein
MRRTCPNGHEFRKSSDCPTCPKCESERKPASGLLSALVFDVRDIEAFKAQAAVNGLMFGGTHRADGYSFSTGKDPDGNSVSISSRDLRDLRAAEG